MAVRFHVGRSSRPEPRDMRVVSRPWYNLRALLKKDLSRSSPYAVRSCSASVICTVLEGWKKSAWVSQGQVDSTRST